MTKRDYLKRLKELNLLTLGYQAGVINLTAITQSEIYDHWLIMADEKSNHAATIDTSVDFNVSISTVERAIRSMKEILPSVNAMTKQLT